MPDEYFNPLPEGDFNFNFDRLRIWLKQQTISFQKIITGSLQVGQTITVGGKIIATDGTESIEIDPAGWGSTQVTIVFEVAATSQQPEITGSKTDGTLFLSGGGAVNNTQIKVAGGIPRIDLEVDGGDRVRIDATRANILSTFLKLPVKTTTGDPSSPVNGDMYVNTFDNTVRVFADAAWRDLATW